VHASQKKTERGKSLPFRTELALARFAALAVGVPPDEARAGDKRDRDEADGDHGDEEEDGGETRLLAEAQAALRDVEASAEAVPTERLRALQAQIYAALLRCNVDVAAGRYADAPGPAPLAAYAAPRHHPWGRATTRTSYRYMIDMYLYEDHRPHSTFVIGLWSRCGCASACVRSLCALRTTTSAGSVSPFESIVSDSN
jgi:hypothetical protein